MLLGWSSWRPDQDNGASLLLTGEHRLQLQVLDTTCSQAPGRVFVHVRYAEIDAPQGYLFRRLLSDTYPTPAMIALVRLEGFRCGVFGRRTTAVRDGPRGEPESNQNV